MNNLGAGYWNNRFINRDTPWDMGYPSTPLKEYFNQLTDKNVSILIPGCGNGYEAAYLLENGFTDIVLIDISPALTKQIEEKFSAYINKELTVITGDFFELNGQFDLIIEQTFFCALDPSLRKKYAVHMQHLLKPRGKLAGVLFNRLFANEGPPFGGSTEEYNELFSPFFHINKLETCYNSIKPRQDAECFFIVQKK
jgi:methyl halide transferase